MSDYCITIYVPAGSGNTMYSDCNGCPLRFICPNVYMANSFCNRFDFSKANFKVMKGKNVDYPSDYSPTEEDKGFVGQMMYAEEMMNTGDDGYIYKQPTTDEYKARKQAENVFRAEMYGRMTKGEIKAEIKRLQ